MAPEDSPSGQSDPDPTTSPTGDVQGDPWLAFGYLVSGVLVYGGIGWGLDRWWGTQFLVVVGILTGITLGLYQTWARFRPQPYVKPGAQPDTRDHAPHHEQQPHDQQAQQ
ncbi:MULTISPECIES: AtpZ/AtpI family protein [Nocardioides]|uniref:AtpZ/AtpI family protein n=1 Tax=Nocardioides kribbensis TaxID=305517 RepID=A0ABV1NWQ1_9ACTN|nr:MULTISPECIES: AtpZ/AtpI family protein [Nocardioides]MBJ7528889.1 AtpZ/AtpI family protein [Nocardioides sp.]MCM3515668.1 AtpZ/AtpI family protein [Nocardioides sp. P86]